MVETHRVEAALACSSDAWKQASVKVWIKPEGLKGEMNLDLTGFTAGPAARRFFPAARPQVEDAFGDIALRLRVDGAAACMPGSMETRSRIAAQRQYEPLLAKGPSKGRPSPGGRENHNLRRAPRKRLSFVQVSRRGGHRPRFTGCDRPDRGSASRCSGRPQRLSLFAGDDRDVRNVFDVVRAGSVSGATLSARGTSLRDMVKAEHISASGSVTGGSIVLPDSLFPVDQIAGQMRIAGGFLEGAGLSGRMGGNTATKSTIRLDLRESTPGTPFRLDLNVRADVAQIPFTSDASCRTPISCTRSRWCTHLPERRKGR